jgi:hypothetical protein
VRKKQKIKHDCKTIDQRKTTANASVEAFVVLYFIAPANPWPKVLQGSESAE